MPKTSRSAATADELAIRFEETDLMAVHGDKYQRYRDRVPMIIPGLANRSGAPAPLVRGRAGLMQD